MIYLITYTMDRAWSVNNILAKKRNLLPFDGDFKELIGSPELRGSWIIYGDSGHGKTSFIMQLSKYLTRFGVVLYESLEEGDGESFKLALQDYNMAACNKQFRVAKDNYDALVTRLKKGKSPQIIVIDSTQYFDIRFNDVKRLEELFPTKLFIFLSHVDATGKKPEGMVARKIKYHSPVKIYIQGYVAFAVSRYLRGTSKPYVVWQEGAEAFHGLNLENPNYTLLKS